MGQAPISAKNRKMMTFKHTSWFDNFPQFKCRLFKNQWLAKSIPSDIYFARYYGNWSLKFGKILKKCNEVSMPFFLVTPSTYHGNSKTLAKVPKNVHLYARYDIYPHAIGTIYLYQKISTMMPDLHKRINNSTFSIFVCLMWLPWLLRLCPLKPHKLRMWARCWTM